MSGAIGQLPRASVFSPAEQRHKQNLPFDVVGPKGMGVKYILCHQAKCGAPGLDRLFELLSVSLCEPSVKAHVVYFINAFSVL